MHVINCLRKFSCTATFFLLCICSVSHFHFWWFYGTIHQDLFLNRGLYLPSSSFFLIQTTERIHTSSLLQTSYCLHSSSEEYFRRIKHQWALCLSKVKISEYILSPNVTTDGQSFVLGCLYKWLMLETRQARMAEDKRTNRPMRLKLEVNQVCYGPKWLHLEKELDCLEALTAVADVRDTVVTSTYEK